MRKIKNSDLIGKTINSIDASSVNVLKLSFTDGSSIELWAEDAVHTSAGSIPGIFVDNDQAAPPTQIELEHNHFGEIFVPQTCPACADIHNKVSSKDK